MSDFQPKDFEELAAYWLHVHGIAHKSASSLKRDQGILRNYLIPSFGNKPLGCLSVAEIDRWFAGLANSGRISRKSCNDHR